LLHITGRGLCPFLYHLRVLMTLDPTRDNGFR
jgi:hypothetical protein